MSALTTTSMTSSTTLSSENETDYKPEEFTCDQIISSAFIGALVIVGFYVTVALFVYGRRMAQRLQATRAPPTGVASETLSASAGGCLLVNNAQILLTIASLLALARFVMELAETRYGRRPGWALCTLLNSANTILMTISLSCVYLVMWLRQRKFNDNLPMQGVAQTIQRCFSYFVLFMLFSSCIVCLVLFLGMRKYRGTSLGCDFDWQLPSTQKYIRVSIIFGFTLIFQLLLLGLLVLPLLKHRKSLERMSSSQRSHLEVMQRLSVCALVAIVWNGTVGAVIVFCLDDAYSMYKQILYDLDFIVLLLCTIVSFKDWRERLAPWCHRSDDRTLHISQLIL